MKVTAAPGRDGLAEEVTRAGTMVPAIRPGQLRIRALCISALDWARFVPFLIEASPDASRVARISGGVAEWARNPA